MVREEDGWHLTRVGRASGGEEKTHPKYGDYVAWPETLTLQSVEQIEQSVGEPKLLTARQLAQHFDIPSHKMNFVLAELGWLQKAIKGWKCSAQGLKLGAQQKEDFRSGVPYVAWPSSIIDNQFLKSSIVHINASLMPLAESSGEYRSLDGHTVALPQHVAIDNWLYVAEILHAYGRQLPIVNSSESPIKSDFYLPSANVYIEYLNSTEHLEPEQKTAEIMAQSKKKSLYDKQGLNVIFLSDDDLNQLDEVLAKKLLKYQILAY